MKEINSAKIWKRIFIWTLILIFSMLFFLQNVNAWYDNNWQYRQIINSSTSIGSTPINYQINLKLNSGNVGTNFNWTRNCEDLRFVNSDDSTLLDYWIKSCNSTNQNASIWIKIPENITTSVKEIYMYYGNIFASNLSNGETTFDFFDNFNNDLSKWTQHKNSAGISITSGYVQVGGGTTSSPYGHAVLGSDASYTNFTNGIIEGEVYLSTDAIAEVGSRGNFTANTGYKSRMDARSGQGVSHLKPPYTDASWNFLSGCSVTGGGMSTFTWLPFKLTINGNSLNIQADGKNITCTDSSYTGSGEISLQNHYGSYSRYDNVRIRKYSANIPILALNSEEIRSISTNDNVAQAYDSDLNQDGNTGPIPISLGGETLIQSNFTHSTTTNLSKLYVNEDGLYKISYACTWISTGANNRLIMENWVRKNGTTTIIPSKMSCYIRNTADGDRCSNSGTLLADLTSGDYIELIGNKLQGANGAIVTHNDCSIYAQKIKNKVVQIYDTVGGQDFDGTIINVNMSSQTYADLDTYTTGASSINFTKTGWYKIYYHVCSESTGENNRQTDMSWLRKNGNENISPSFTYSYIRQTGDADRNCNQAALLMNFSAGDYVELQHTKRAQEGVGTTITLANQNWMFAEKIESDSIMSYEKSGGFNVNSGETELVTLDTPYKIGNYITQIGSKLYFNRNGIYEISYNLGWMDGGGNSRTIACSRLKLNGLTSIIPSQQCDYSRGDDQAKWQSTSSNLIINVSKNDYVELEVSAIGNSLSVESNSTWISAIKLDETPEIYWKESNVNLGDTTINEGNVVNTTSILSYRNNYNVNVACISGNCSSIITNWTSYSFNDAEEKQITFTCSDITVGDFWATYAVTSDQDSTNNIVNVSCKVYKIYGNIEVNLDVPTPSSIINVGQNKTFTIEATVNCVGDAGTTCGNISAMARYNKSIGQFGDGSDGSLIVNVSDTVINDYAYMINTENFDDDIITINDPTFFSVGDEILIIQMQNGTGIGTAGAYEFNTIKEINGFDFTLDEPLSKTYGSGTFDTTTSTVTQVVRVPQYINVTITGIGSITAPAWNGYLGGIVIFRSQNFVDTQGYINVSEKGFRGGDCNGCGNSAWGDQGEGISGTGTGSLSTNINGGGGGYGPSGYGGEPGAGGGYATQGGTGISSAGFDAIGGSTVGDSNLSVILFGGGAGGGGDNDNKMPAPEYVDGGGIAMIFSKEITNARVHSKGETGFWPGSPGGTTGSGAGGSIWLGAENITLFDVDALGGPSIPAGSDTGGAGGDGRVRLDYLSATGNSNPVSGYNGSLQTSFTMSKIPTSSIVAPLISISSNSQNCGILNASENCTLTWIVNATGEIGTEHLIDVIFKSDKVKVISNNTQNATINITSIIVPIINLISPSNGLKFMSNGSVEFNWTISDDGSNINCSLYLDGIFNKSISCINGNNSLQINVERGYHEWFIEAVDEDNNSVNSFTWNFTIIKKYWSSVTKSITSINTDLYQINIDVENKLNISQDLNLVDFVNNRFNYGSFSVIYDWSNSTLGIFNGTILGWNLITTPLSINQINYSITKNTNDYYLLDEFMLGLD